MRAARKDKFRRAASWNFLHRWPSPFRCAKVTIIDVDAHWWSHYLNTERAGTNTWYRLTAAAHIPLGHPVRLTAVVVEEAYLKLASERQIPVILRRALDRLLIEIDVHS